MATRSELQQNDLVLIVDLASNSGRSSPHPALGRMISFLDDANSQALVKYHGGQVDRPVGNLVRIVKAGVLISEKGQGICPLSQANEEIQAAWDQVDDEEEEEGLQDAPEVRPGQGDEVDVQEVQRHLPGSHSPLPPPTPDRLLAVEDPEEQATVLTPEEGDTSLHPLQGEQRNEAAQYLIGLERRDGNAIPETGRPRRVKRPVNKFV